MTGIFILLLLIGIVPPLPLLLNPGTDSNQVLEHRESSPDDQEDGNVGFCRTFTEIDGADDDHADWDDHGGRTGDGAAKGAEEK